MCENIELDLDEDTVKNIAIIVKSEMSKTADKCSLELYNVDKINTYEQLIEATGITMINSVLSSTLQEAIVAFDQAKQDDMD